MKRKNKRENTENINPYKKEYGLFSNISYILKKLHKYSKTLIILMLCTAITQVIITYLWSFIGKNVLEILEKSPKSKSADLSPLIVTLAIFAVVEVVSRLIHTFCGNQTQVKFIMSRQYLIGEKVAKTLSMNYQSLEKPIILDMRQRADNAVGGNEVGIEGMMRNISRLLTEGLSVVCALTAIIILDIRLILVLILICAVQYLFQLQTVKKDKREVWDKLSPEWRRINYMQYTTQDFDSAKDIRLFDMKDYLTEKQREIHKRKADRVFYSKKLWTINSVFSGVVNLISVAAVYAVLIFCVINRDMSIGDFTLYLGLTATFSGALTGLLQIVGNMKRQSLEIDDFRSFMDIDTKDKGEFLPLPTGDTYEFQFKNVSFKYFGSENYALKNINLTLEPHKKLAVVGLNGAGKTTLIKLLLRLYDTEEGEILLNGINIKRFKRKEYYKMFSPVFQNVELFAFPYCENVAMKPIDELDRNRVEEVSRSAGLGDKLIGMPHGIDTELLKVLSDEGVDFSGGERQKLALARAFYKNAPVVVLDEPTAALDALAEYELYKSFDEIIGNKTAVYISHRLSSTRFCDAIACFDNGEMVEYGTHEQLLDKGGVYAEMFKVQSQYYKESEGERVAG